MSQMSAAGMARKYSFSKCSCKFLLYEGDVGCLHIRSTQRGGLAAEYLEFCLQMVKLRLFLAISIYPFSEGKHYKSLLPIRNFGSSSLLHIKTTGSILSHMT